MTLNNYKPEGMLIGAPENREALSSKANLEKALANGKILEGMAILCDGDMTLHIDLGCMEGVIYKNEAAYQPDGSELKDIAIITRVGKAVCFKIIGINYDENGKPTAILSRKAAQRECIDCYLNTLTLGDIIPAKVTHLEHFGAFVDIGCGIISLLSIDSISVSRISHPRDRFYLGMYIKTIVKNIEFTKNGSISRIFVSHKELLGTWEENAALFECGQTVAGVVRSIENYGIFVELTPNLAGLAEYREDVVIGQTAAVFIKSIVPEKMKIKLVLIDSYKGELSLKRMQYFLSPDSDHIDYWKYSPSCSRRTIETFFTDNQSENPDDCKIFAFS